MSINRWTCKEDVAHTYDGILLTHEERGHAIRSNVDEPRDGDTRWSRPDREIEISRAINSMWNLKKGGKGTNGLIYKSEIDSHT